MQRVRATQIHQMRRRPPGGYSTWQAFAESIPIYEGVDITALTQGDSDPFYVTLDILVRGATSVDGVLYNDALIDAVQQQLPGTAGFRGHTDTEMQYPDYAVHWVGHTEVDGITYAKGYIPPGVTREDVRRLVATNGKLRTSFHAYAAMETNNGVRTVTDPDNFVLSTLDIVPHARAALQVTEGDITITKQTREVEELTMQPQEITDVNQVPQHIRQQIEEQARQTANVQQLQQTVESQNAELEELRQMRQYASIVTEIRTYLGEDADVVEVVRQMHEQISRMSDILGVAASDISINVLEMHEQVQQMRQQQTRAQINDVVRQMTDWGVKTDDGKAKVEKLRKQFGAAIQRDLGDDADDDAIKQTAQRLWGDLFSLTADTLKQSLMGPAAATSASKGEERPELGTDEWRKYMQTKGWRV